MISIRILNLSRIAVLNSSDPIGVVDSSPYYLWLSDKQAGPYSLQQLTSMWSAGTINAETLWWTNEFTDWQPLSALEPRMRPGIDPDAGPIREVLSASRLLIAGSAAVLLVVLLGTVILLKQSATPAITEVRAMDAPSAEPKPGPVTNPARTAADLVAEAESSLRAGDFGSAASLLNVLSEDHPLSAEGLAILKLKRIFRSKTGDTAWPVVPEEAARIRTLLDSFQTLQAAYQTATDKQRQALDAIFGPQAFNRPDKGLTAIADVAENLLRSREGGSGTIR